VSTLYDILKQKLASGTAPVIQPEQDQVQATLAAKSGKAAAGTAVPAASNVQEAAAIDQGKAQLAQQQVAGQQLLADVGQQEGALAAQGQAFQATQAADARAAADRLATQNTAARDTLSAKADTAAMQTQATEGIKVAQINQNAANKLKELATERGTTVDDIFSEFDNSNKELEFRKDAASLEQAGFLLALRDKSYVAEIQRIGQERGLQDELAFREEAQRVVWGNQLSDLVDKLKYQTGFNAQARKNEMNYADIDIDWALQFANAAIRDNNNRAVAEGAVAAGRAGADAYARNTETRTKPTAAEPTNSNPVQSDTGYNVMEN
jgi:hypothetical protein